MTHPETTGDLAMQVLREHAKAFAEHVPQARPGADPEHVHVSRVATRRLRAALRVFEDILPPDIEALHAELGWIASQLGPVRDLDVQLHRVEGIGAGLGLADAMQPYAGWLVERRERAQVVFDAALHSDRFVALSEHLRALDEAVAEPQGDVDAEEDAPQRLHRAYRKLRKRGDPLTASSAVEAFHRARISAKRLRYTAEFFEPLYGKPADALIDTCVSVQDLLGDQQDGVVNRQHIDEAVRAATWPSETTLALGQLIQWEAHHAEALRHEFKPAYKDVRVAWRRLRHSF